MKNNSITSYQFFSTMFLSTLAYMLFFDNTATVFQLLYILLALGINILFISFYRGKRNIISNIIIYLYFTVISALSVAKLSQYMHVVLKSGPYWAIILLILISAYFCSYKGLEPLARASQIILFFVFIFLLYIFISPFSTVKMDFSRINTHLYTNFLPILILLLPSFSYVALNDNITDCKKSPLFIYSVIEFAVLGLSVFFSSFLNAYYPMDVITKNVKYGIFKGGDCLYLTIITISVLYIISIGCQSATVNHRKYKLKNAVFIGITGVATAFLLLFI